MKFLCFNQKASQSLQDPRNVFLIKYSLEELSFKLKKKNLIHLLEKLLDQSCSNFLRNVYLIIDSTRLKYFWEKFYKNRETLTNIKVYLYIWMRMRAGEMSHERTCAFDLSGCNTPAELINHNKWLLVILHNSTQRDFFTKN